MATAKAAAKVPCTNCGSDKAKYTLGDVNNVIYYCDRCLPSHFVAQAAAGKFPLVKSL